MVAAVHGGDVTDNPDFSEHLRQMQKDIRDGTCMGRPMYYRMDGTPYTGPNAMLDWANDSEAARKDGSFKVGHTELRWGGRVSTVWLGLDHSFGFDGSPPCIFESMVFGPGSYADLDMNRYSTLEQAKAGHEEMVRRWDSGWVAARELTRYWVDDLRWKWRGLMHDLFGRRLRLRDGSSRKNHL